MFKTICTLVIKYEWYWKLSTVFVSLTSYSGLRWRVSKLIFTHARNTCYQYGKVKSLTVANYCGNSADPEKQVTPVFAKQNSYTGY